MRPFGSVFIRSGARRSADLDPIDQSRGLSVHSNRLHGLVIDIDGTIIFKKRPSEQRREMHCVTH